MSDQAPAEETPALRPAPPARSTTFTRRFRALVIDYACVWGLCLALFFLGDAASSIPGVTRLTWLLMLAAVLLYDPVLVSRRGATVGHLVARLSVVDVRTGHWPSFARAFGRSFIKLTLGIASIFTMELSRRRQTVHDMLTHTTVRVAESAELVELGVEQVDEPDVVMPSGFRRATVIVIYLVAVLLGSNLLIAGVYQLLCSGTCGAGPQGLLEAIAFGWLALSAWVIIVGWKGLLLGARRSRRVASDVFA
jgi:uncharacterized RDD family membrane protein YckC